MKLAIICALLLASGGCAHTAPLIHSAALYDPQIHECRSDVAADAKQSSR